MLRREGQGDRVDPGGRESASPSALTRPLGALTRPLGALTRQWFWRLVDSAREYKQRQTMDAAAALGRRGENLAHRYLRARGMTVVARNVRLPDGSGEID